MNPSENTPPPESGTPASEPRMKALRDYVRANAQRFLQDNNITSVGVGYRIKTDGESGREVPTSELCIQFTVASKPEVSGVALEALDTSPIPETLVVAGEEIPTDVIQREYGLAYRIESHVQTNQRKLRLDPVQPGVSVSHHRGTAGTLGLVVIDNDSGDPSILSNWHVLHGNAGQIGDPVVQPGPFDHNQTEANRAGRLTRSHLGPPGDCAIAKIEDRSFLTEVMELQVRPRQIARVELGDKVVKSGRTTGVTQGVVRRVDVMTKIHYGGEAGTRAIGCFEIGAPDGAGAGYEVSLGGDSGSAWLVADQEGKATDILAGLHFAGEAGNNPDEHALACYAHSVFKKLGISLTPESRPDPSPPVVEVVKGYDPRFTPTEVPRPWMTDEQYRDAVLVDDSPMIPYTHFSLSMSKKRGFARFVAWNIDGGRIRRESRDGINFRLDPRVKAEFQHDDTLYKNNPLDRGHIARRADLVWGSPAEARKANVDSFFFTNIAPQHRAFNQSRLSGIWGELENAVFADVDVAELRISVLGGPLFRPDDPVHRGVRIPKDFWKLLAYQDNADGRFKVAAYLLTQRDLITDLEILELDPFRVYQVSLEKLEEETQLTFRGIGAYDTFRPGPEIEALPGRPRPKAREVRSVETLVRFER